MRNKKIWISFLLLIVLILITGCGNDGVIFLNATSNGDCLIKCKEQSSYYNYHCMEAVASFNSKVINGELIDKECECVLLNCFKEVDKE